MSADGAVGRVANPAPSALTRACLVGAALLPWFALLSGIYGLYFYVVLAATLLAQWLFIPALVLAAPLAVLLLMIMPAGVIYTAVGRRPQGWAGRLPRAGCLVSMGFAVTYGSLVFAIGVGPGLGNGAVEGWSFSLIWRVGSLIIGLLATWRAWRWLRR